MKGGIYGNGVEHEGIEATKYRGERKGHGL